MKNRPAPISARSISRPVWDSLQRALSEGQVLAVFQRTCLLQLPGDKVVALVLPEIGNGPLNIVLESVDRDSRGQQCDAFSGIEPGMVASLGGTGLRIGGMEVMLGGAELWEPRPDWERLHRNRGPIEGRLQRLCTLALRQAPEGSLLELLSNGFAVSQEPTGFGRPAGPGMETIQDALQHLQAGWDGDLAGLQTGGARLAGLGGGLTPAGDDFLCGVMLWAWLAHSAARRFCGYLLEASMARTTMLSASLLRAAAEGECSAGWHDLLAVLASGPVQQMERAVSKVVSFGHTSGADTLAGFVWTGLTSRQI